MEDQALKWARVADLNYLSWGCRNTIECLAREASFTKDGIVLPPGEALSVRGLARPYDLAVHLYGIGWIPRRPANKAYRMAYTATNQTRTGLILMRKNGIDVQITESLPTEEMRPNSLLRTSRTDAPFIEQQFHGSLHNVFERTANFAEAFLRNEPGLEEMVAPLRTTKTLPRRPHRMPEEEILYSAFGGTVGPIYLSDGIWLTADGRLYDWGR
ncbi:MULTISPECIES: hypothetical protein [unclassified Mesorhizobium]|uniref:hypothetical protein n=1 Tax=unclassified Mesorhizobium TaxID=325217 RepID=UPI00333C5B46